MDFRLRSELLSVFRVWHKKFFFFCKMMFGIVHTPWWNETLFYYHTTYIYEYKQWPRNCVYTKYIIMIIHIFRVLQMYIFCFYYTNVIADLLSTLFIYSFIYVFSLQHFVIGGSIDSSTPCIRVNRTFHLKSINVSTSRYQDFPGCSWVLLMSK